MHKPALVLENDTQTPIGSSNNDQKTRPYDNN